MNNHLHRWNKYESSSMCVFPSVWIPLSPQTLDRSSQVKCMLQLSVDFLGFVRERTKCSFSDTREMSESMSNFSKAPLLQYLLSGRNTRSTSKIHSVVFFKISSNVGHGKNAGKTL